MEEWSDQKKENSYLIFRCKILHIRNYFMNGILLKVLFVKWVVETWDIFHRNNVSVIFKFSWQMSSHHRSLVFEADEKGTALLKRCAGCPESGNRSADQLCLTNLLRILVRPGGARTLVSQITNHEVRDLGDPVCFASCSGQGTVAETAGDPSSVDSPDTEFREWNPFSLLTEPVPTSTPSLLRQPTFKKFFLCL